MAGENASSIASYEHMKAGAAIACGTVSGSDELEKFPERLPAVTEVAVLIPDLEGYEVALKKFLGQVPNVKTLVLNWATNARILAEIIYILFQQCPLLHTLDVAAMSKHNDWDSKDI
ncbi:hypothetical protein BDP27DRAFT_1370047 [Rhodocollybia butyracea]|uniref:Uncharacterized protein n=1 Tax=Rhodocollybia butyracea TaxID=206335 RepID=A0A9P5PF58_9AGAR|nr:hypothetical protein BDP27DRAFT_1370047 [Rhodocollybia butyracea]